MYDPPGMKGHEPNDGGAGCLIVLLVIGIFAALAYKVFGA